MEGYSSQIAERIRMLQEQNDALSKEKEAADKAMAEGKNVSEPVVEQVKPDPNKKKDKKKKKVSVQRSDIAKALETVQHESESAPSGQDPEQKKSEAEPKPEKVKPEPESIKKEPEKTDPKPAAPEPEIEPQTAESRKKEEAPATEENLREKGSSAALDASIRNFEDLLGEDSGRRKKSFKSTVSITGEEAERIRAEIKEELRREMEAEQEKKQKDLSARHRGPHAVIQKKIKYVDTSGTPLKSFCLIDTATGEIRPLKDVVLVGKNENCDLVIPNRYVSRRHAKITCRAGAYYIEDLGSTNGTTVNGEMLQKGSGEKMIEPGDIIEFAACSFIFDAIG